METLVDNSVEINIDAFIKQIITLSKGKIVKINKPSKQEEEFIEKNLDELYYVLKKYPVLIPHFMEEVLHYVGSVTFKDSFQSREERGAFRLELKKDPDLYEFYLSNRIRLVRLKNVLMVYSMTIENLDMKKALLLREYGKLSKKLIRIKNHFPVDHQNSCVINPVTYDKISQRKRLKLTKLVTAFCKELIEGVIAVHK